MAGDLEEFLKRAAERRAQKQGGAAPKTQPKQAAPVERPSPVQRQTESRPRPEYTDARRERQVRAPIEEAIPIAEIIEPVNPLLEQEARVAEAKRRADEARKKMSKIRQSKPQAAPVMAELVPDAQGSPADQLFELLKSPDGVRQAFLLREILDRPDFDRW